MDNACIILDTNAYRYFASMKKNDVKKSLNLIGKINSIEQRKEITSFISHFVAMELLSHLSDPNDPHFEQCRAAATCIYEHNIIKSLNSIRFIADPTAHLTLILYNMESPSTADFTNRINELLHIVYQNKSSTSFSEIEADLKDLKKFIDEKEKEFINDMWNSVIKTVDPKATKWDTINKNKKLRKKVIKHLRSESSKKIIARTLIFRAMIALNKTEPPEKIEEKIQILMDNFRVQIEFYNQILEKILVHGTNVKKRSRRNWIWDLQIAFNVGEHHTIKDKKVYLITRDKEIISASKSSQLDKFILTPEKYLEILGV